MTLTQRVTKGFAVLSSVLLGTFILPVAAETINEKAADVIHTPTLQNNSHTAGNCQQIEHDTIVLSGSTAIFAQPQTDIQFSPGTAPRTVLFTLAAPLQLTENCVLGADTSTLIEAQLETTDSMEGLIIKTQSIVVSGHYLPLVAESNMIPFEKYVKQHSVQQTNSPLCTAIGILPNVLIDSHKMGVGISSQDLSLMTGSFCELVFSSQSSYFLQAELKSDTFYNLRLPGVQSIPVPSALRTFVVTE